MRRAMEHMGVSKETLNDEAVKMLQAQAQALLDLVKKTDKPIVGYTWGSAEEPFYKMLLEGGFPVFIGAERAARALGAMVRYNRLREKL
jgi:acyl-CoA synthetase (NDP forming)